MSKKTLATEPHGKVEYIVPHRQRCESGDYRQVCRNKAGIDPLAPLTSQSAQLREVPTDHEAPSEQE